MPDEDLSETEGIEAWQEDHFGELTDHLGSEVSSSTTTHSRQLFERVFDFKLAAESEDVRKRITVDTYFFIPRSVGLNRDNFTRSHFYNSLSSFLRIQTYEGLRRSALKTGSWNLPHTEAYFKAYFQSRERSNLAQCAIQEVKLFACLMENQLKNLRLQLRKTLKRRAGRLSSRVEYFQRKLTVLLELLATFRTLYLAKIRAGEVWVDEEVRLAFVLSDEFLSYRLESILINLNEILESGKKIQECQLFQAEILEVLQTEMQYREVSGQLQIQEITTESIQETYYYRLGLLKKFVSDVLYLDIRNLQKDKAYRNLVAAAGAALAATWAGLVDLQRFYWLQNINQEGPVPTSDFALRFFLIVIVGVFAYIFKDRIKELTREYFYERLKQFLPDYEYSVFYKFANPASQSEIKVAQAKQYMRYLNKEALPAEIAYIREWGHPNKLEPERSEEVIHFSKQLDFDTEVLRKRFAHIRFIRDISRFSIDEFLLRIDDPNKKLRYFDQNKGVATMKAPKVYHLNLVSRYAVCEYQAGEWLPARVDFEHLRLVLNKKGIIRVEKVLPHGELGYLESVA
ncbi:hypothetical protein COW36_19680 [bacterium (Candidatus Blackallbacteria) CG17_big_fil_post_rev_8_21_14_2_50_48_46]|uniref:Uncharacterized protein n=1 Tax=bacterium (Candidatus Blackallbacteria) CG17_big_fil_post_rev_8_21_14_2_50_48_46 TaxID=2014261 RepID=A0A2M7FZN7_9BACT|nr:MAG: hypothetical protein COW64_15615 [bacterium (Candidatus Blackallbacteria) CG18_big_fil_WC_8_21_14_2_50_49_26]PIW14874.1 MAG: hypothetical protein COW36_19680 [bacterium (Candidatus Blackallbacteria) CG17_big_fil_post_rev_8_21_14_2_50_48_46]PIW44441.1 MAG: hypothetical protein COW20_24255 [bacterium (Candidatus Blackallbacteria) CG13_big_fil_rev_8_21_14_2_50_49_14]